MVFDLFKTFAKSEHGEAGMGTALIVSAAVFVMAVLAVPFIDNASRQFSDPGSGIDYTVTSSTEEKSEPKRFVVRKSILDQTQAQPFPTQ